MPDWSTEPHFLPVSVLQVTKVVSPWSLKWKKLTVPFRKKTPFVPTLLLMTNDIMKGLLACFCPCCCWGGSQHSLRDSLGVCSSEHCLGAQSTRCVSGKILITLVRLCVLGTPDGSSLLTEDYLGWRIAVRQQPGPVPLAKGFTKHSVQLSSPRPPRARVISNSPLSGIACYWFL